MSAASGEQPPVEPGTPLRSLVAGLTLLEAVMLLGGSVALVVDGLRSQDAQLSASIAMAAVVVVVGIGLVVCARGVLHGRRWTRGPVLTWQLLQAGVAMPLSASGAWWAGVPLLAVAVVVGVLIAGRQVITETADRFGVDPG